MKQHPRNRTIQTTNRFILRKRTRKSSGKVYYELACNLEHLDYWWEKDEIDRVRDVVDPTRNRSGHWGTSWKYTNRAAAERDLLLLTMML